MNTGKAVALLVVVGVVVGAGVMIYRAAVRTAESMKPADAWAEANK